MKTKIYIKSLYHSFRKNPTVINIVAVATVTLIVKGFGFYKEIIIASNFGLSELLDTFLIAALVPGFIYQVFLGAFKSVFIPNYIIEQKSNRPISSFQTTSFIVTIGTTAIFMFLAYLFTNTFLETFFPNHSESYYKLIKVQFTYLLPCILFWGLSSLISGLLNIYNEFKYSTIYPVFTSVAILVLLLFFKDLFQEKVLAIGMLIGSILEFTFLAIVAKSKNIINLTKPDFKADGTKMMFNQLPAKVSSGFLTGLIPITDQYFAAQLIVGSIAALNYALKIPAFFTGIVVLALARVLLPHFSKLTTENRESAFKQLNKILKFVFISIILIIIPIILFSDSIIELVFERNEFTSDDTLIVSGLQIVLLIGAPFYICGNILVQFLTSINKNTFMAYVSFGSMTLNIILDYIFLKLYGIYGIVLCTTTIYMLRSLILYIYTNKQKNL
ncbi:murein biosynthesis integral membrane protein MurJ [Formosa maritima]|uniref:murein biosynthesis integral membrane protein MurJ n=1 Tax=Formosa maritima TaxID=2592046 RepID=UPI0018F57E4C|nr:lipid II flippase MurJ [Formosa maritima]